MSVDVYGTEPERQAALAEVTRLRRQFDTTTAKGAKAFAADPTAQAAVARLDAAKSAAGMRTSAQDLQALNEVSGRRQTQQLNAPSQQYFAKVTEAYSNPSNPPTWGTQKKVTPDLIQEYAQYGTDASKARFDWVWTQDEKGNGKWGIGLVGLLQQKPADITKAKPLDIFYSDSAPLAKAREIAKQPSWNATFQNISLDELEQVIPDLTFSKFQEVYYQLTLERDEDITVEDIIRKYNEMYRGK